MSDDDLEVVGVVRDVCRGVVVVDVEIGGHVHTTKCVRAGRLRMNHIAVLVGDRVRVRLSPFDTSRGRVVYRARAGEALT